MEEVTGEHATRSAENSLRYAVLWHCEIPEPHYDLLVETSPGSDLTTWRSPVWPIEAATDLQPLKPHRRIYLDYQGDLNLGRGRVERIAGGICTIEIDKHGIWHIALTAPQMELELWPESEQLWRGVAK